MRIFVGGMCLIVTELHFNYIFTYNSREQKVTTEEHCLKNPEILCFDHAGRTFFMGQGHC